MRSKHDTNFISQTVFDEETSSNRVRIVGTQLELNLDAKKDSVTNHPAKLTVSATECTEQDFNQEVIPSMDCSSLNKVRVDINGYGKCEIFVSPTDSGNYFYSIGGEGQIHEICARRLKVISINVKGTVHLVGKS